ncbi:Uncharacterised protein (plasmid) [Tsukamurella tyrosinosolvens]|uniref:Uncharacterized protein n=1 Tax=Tsukamurella tyrosinosolvens TaxID=57704 RepID=A0A1H4VEU2_TSUTY|nr:hypothetical protein [Tsukamurella tyrosinosolvens]KXO90998.1 hypothetical protein AXK58_21445 [Tsukamurella tyrosinosolvens]SEC79390.1 hypothetical protein SAMN04489793_3204 [Tsukamurella tyrosinosolvens]VEH90566.1 Uncharacterised protein [Tsukamurella tyrosinosolvens]
MADILMAEAPVAIGYDRRGQGQTVFYALTPCCAATGTGSDSGIVCRGCYRELDFEYAGFWYFDGHEDGLSSTWDLYNIALMNTGVDQDKAEVLVIEAKRQAERIG